MAAPYFPLRDGVSWIYSVTGPVIQRIFRVWVEPQVDIEVEDLVTHAVRPERAWVLREEDAPKPTFAVEREDGIQFYRERHLSEPKREAIVLKQDLRWGGPPTWAVPSLHYSLTMLQHRRAGEEDVLVTAGRFKCLKIFVDEGERGAVWIAPGVGTVREVYEIEGLDSTRYSVVELHTQPADVRHRS